MEYKDYYDILGVSREASEKEIKSSYRRLARQYHPDVNPGDAEAEERFKEINEAYEVLSDTEKRQKYEQLGRQWSQWQQRGRQPGGFDWGQWTTQAPSEGERVHVRYGTPEDLQDLFGGASPFSEFFTQVFGGMGAEPTGREYAYRQRPQRGQDLEQEVVISLEEAYHGATRLLQKEGRQLEITIPPGARTGTRVRLSGEGGTGGGGGAPGDLYLRVRVLPDPRFERHGDDLETEAPVDLYTAILGGEAPVPTMGGAVLLTIPPRTQNGKVFRLSGKGMPELAHPEKHGDLLARVNVQLPTELSSEEVELFRELQALSSGGQET